MALQTPIVSLISVTEAQEKLYSLTLHLVVADSESGWSGIDQTFTDSFPAGGNVANKVIAIRGQMQEAIDRYNHAKAIAKSTAMANAIASIQSGLVI